MVLCDKSQLEIQGSKVVPFRMETRRVIRVQDVMFVPGLKYRVISISMIDRKGFEVLFQDGKVRLGPRGSKSDGIVLGFREHGIYRLRGKHADYGKKQVEQVQVLEM